MMITVTKVKARHIPYPPPAPPHTHTGYTTGGYRSYRRWVSRSWRR